MVLKSNNLAWNFFCNVCKKLKITLIYFNAFIYFIRKVASSDNCNYHYGSNISNKVKIQEHKDKMKLLILR